MVIKGEAERWARYKAGRSAVFEDPRLSLTDTLRQNSWNLVQLGQAAPKDSQGWPAMLEWMKEDDAEKARKRSAKTEAEKKKTA